MLSRLQVKNYVLIDSLEIDFPEGLIIITGETGAGKSILLGALGLVMGSKSDASVISEGADCCVVEAEFDVKGDTSLRQLFEENDMEWDEGHVIVRRVVNRSGRSRAFVNDSPVSVQLLQDISSYLIDIHSQHQTMLLSDKRFQMGILDHFAGSSALCGRCSEAWRELSAMRSELSRIQTLLERMASERDYNEAQFRQLESAGIRVGELAELDEEQKQLANAEEIKSSLCAIEELFTASSSEGAVLSVDSILKESDRLLSRIARYVPSASELAERVVSCRRELDDVLSEISVLNARTEVSEERLMQVEDRMSFIYGLMQKHGCADEEELISLRDALSEKLYDSGRLEDECGQLQDRISVKETELQKIADELHEMRADASVRLAESMTQSVRGLEMPFAVFEVELLPVQTGPSGRDSVQFRFSSAGRNAVDIAKCASGGELSRIMLALKAMKARYADMPTMVFDEIDTGVSGSVADKMGSMICEMGNNMQVFAITHLPQVAAKGNAHYLVSKTVDAAASSAVSTIKKLSDEQRVLEVARMLSGSVLTDAAVANAKALLGV